MYFDGDRINFVKRKPSRFSPYGIMLSKVIILELSLAYVAN